MIGNNLKITVRTLTKHLGYSTLNVVGLAVSMTLSLLIFMYVANELSYESMHDKNDRIYRVASNWGTGGQKELMLGNYEPLGPALNESLGEQVNSVDTHWLFTVAKND
jgi:putative ABC transport system permease protein